MDYADFLPEYPTVEDPVMQQKILNKKEFFDFRLETLARRAEPVPNHVLQQHQHLIQRFLSAHTPYNELLLYHETGTGKTRAAFAAAEASQYPRIFFLARGEDQLKNAEAELLYYAQSLPQFAQKVSAQAPHDPAVPIEKHLAQALGGKYTFETWQKYIRNIRILNDDQLIERYNHTLFIIDEVHNIRATTDALSTYAQLKRVFQTLPDRKVILMTGTPMRDQISDLAGIMNLILPPNQQLPMGDAFTQRFFDLTQGVLRNPDKLEEFLRGRVSYLRALPDAGVQRIFVGEFIDPQLPAEQFRYFATTMLEPQRQGYARAYAKDISRRSAEDPRIELDGDRAANFYSHSRQASLFVYPDGSWGPVGYQKYVRGQAVQSFTAHITPLQNLRKYSSKYAFILEQLESHPTTLMYVYSSLIAGSGLDVFKIILEKYGYAPCKGTELTPRKRYILLTSETQADINVLIRYFNHERNVRGEYCQVILGSRIISEGFTFKNIGLIHILTLHWNYTETQQAIARAIRYGSHRALLDRAVANAQTGVPVYIYQHAALPGSRTEVIDLQMFAMAQRKDVAIRRMTRLLKEIAVDCPLVYERNRVDANTSDARECDYLPNCEYSCAQMESPDNQPTRIDLNTFRLYYQDSQDLDVWNAVRRFFETTSSGLPVDFHSLQDELQVDMFQLVRVLSDMIRYNVPVKNRYGMECYLREDHNELYLVENILLPNQQRELAWYAHRPTIVETQSLQSVLRRHGYPLYAQRIDELRAHPENADTLLELLPLELRNLYKSLRQERRQENVQSEGDVIRLAQSRGMPFYGTVDPDNIFRIVQLSQNETDTRKISSGTNCEKSGFNKNEKMIPAFFQLGIPITLPASFVDKYPDPEAEVRKQDPALLSHPSIPKTRDALLQVLFLLEKGKPELCSMLQEWLRGQQLLAFLANGKQSRKSKVKQLRRDTT